MYSSLYEARMYAYAVLPRGGVRETTTIFSCIWVVLVLGPCASLVLVVFLVACIVLVLVAAPLQDGLMTVVRRLQPSRSDQKRASGGGAPPAHGSRAVCSVIHPSRFPPPRPPRRRCQRYGAQAHRPIL